jgi:hypothetical protein
VPRVHSNCFACCTVTISNNGVHSTNALMAPVHSHARSSVSGQLMVGDLEQEGVKGGRAAAPSRAGGRPSLKTTFCAVGVLTIQAENSVDSQSKADVLRGGAHAGRTPTCGRGGREPSPHRRQRPQCPHELLQCRVLRCLALSQGCIFATSLSLGKQRCPFACSVGDVFGNAQWQLDRQIGFAYPYAYSVGLSLRMD